MGDTITATLTVTEKRPEKGNLVLQCHCVNQNGETVITGTAHVRAPSEKVRRARIELPGVQISRHERFRTLLARAAGAEPVTTAVAHPCDVSALGAAAEAARAGLIRPILVGPKGKIIRAAERAGTDIAAFSADLLLTDAVVNIAPDLARKRDIVQNAIDLAHVMGIEMPRVAILSAVETVNEMLRSTLDAAALWKMADRGLITGGLVDGPLAFDNAVSPGGGRDKGDRFKGCGASRYPRRARSRGRQHAGQAADLPGRCRCRWYRPRRPGARPAAAQRRCLLDIDVS
jgi:hypothetical protein